MIYNLYHADSDGYFAGFCVYDAFRNSAEMGLVKGFKVQYNEPLPMDLDSLTREDAVFIVDFSYPRDVLIELSKRVGRLTVLDHHKSAREALSDIYKDLDKECISLIHFDMTKSGALLAWEYFNPNKEVPTACKYVNDRDLWKWEFGANTAAFEAYLRVNKITDDWSDWTLLTYQTSYAVNAVEEGKRYLKYEQAVVSNFLSGSKNTVRGSVQFGGHMYTFLLYEGMGILTSELGTYGYTNNDVDFTIEHRIRGDKMVFSLRSNRIDVGSLAVAIPGGGGHTAAAGFSMPLEEGLKAVFNLRTMATDLDHRTFNWTWMAEYKTNKEAQ